MHNFSTGTKIVQGEKVLYKMTRNSQKNILGNGPLPCFGASKPEEN
jgi:hypothetical protein